METKRCCKCGELKELSAFAKNKTRKDGFAHQCKLCHKLYMVTYYQLNKNRLDENHKKYFIENNNKINKHRRNPKFYERRRKYLKEYRINNHSKAIERERAYFKKITDNLDDIYICYRLKTKISETPKELIEAKRAQIQLLRACK